MTGTRRKYLSLEAGRFFAALAVVLFHIDITTSQPKYFGHHVARWFAGGFSGVEFFFVLSGFVIVSAHYADLRSPDKAAVTRTFLWKRFVRLYPALWGILLVLAPAVYFVTALQWSGPVSLVDVVAAFAITPISEDRILAVEWTLRYEVLFYALFALLLWKRALGISGFAILIGLSLLSYAVSVSGIAGFFVSPYPLMFVAGAAIAFASRTMALRFAWPSCAIGAAIFLWRLKVCADHPAREGLLFWDSTFFGLGAALIVYGLVAWESRRPIAVPRALQYLGAASYSIYLIHYPVVSLSAKVAMKLRPHVTDPLLFVLMAVVAVGSGIAYHEGFEKRIIALLRRAPRTSAAPSMVSA
ncbi:acyltransferase [Sphingomonas sp. AP4-R1]|uniref:acyltransferase family protein n=1 Tax=Sphingomonas sp. AP4-R1 TaxID=2735134 RepID=UPI001493B324|nr:acyltransferase [Sphingomonas sp. AP4-R1]QJU57275.1 acyltransferase [Sphingomonas sp. AP4-R1]